jgi:hypothetical protein
VTSGNLLAGLHPNPVAEEAAEVLRLRQRALGPWREDLQRPVLEQVAKHAGDPLAEGDVDPVGTVDHQPQALGGGPLEGEQLDVRLLIMKPGLDCFLYLLEFCVHS